jgi:hypothetical protein
MKTARFSSKYTDKNDGEKIETNVTVDMSDLRKDLGQKFVFISIDQSYHWRKHEIFTIACNRRFVGLRF